MLAAYAVGAVVSRGNLAEAAGFLLAVGLVPALFLRRAKPARPVYHAWTLAMSLLAAFGTYYGRTR